MWPHMIDNTVRAKYVFLDIVSYSHNRSVEAQTEVISALNAIVLKALVESGIQQDGQILLPTGDGICIVIVDVSAPYDIHLRIALTILRELKDHNASTPDAMRRFEVRIGLNENVDNKIIDINGKPNIAGAGINLAQRIMSGADGNQVLVSEAVYETLRHREHYMKKFRSYVLTVKHRVTIQVHQYLDEIPHLDVQVPTQFRPDTRKPKRMTKYAAYYIAHAAKNRSKLLKLPKLGQESYTTVVLLSFLAVDSLGLAEQTDSNRYDVRTWGAGKATFEEQAQFYNKQTYWVICDLSGYLTNRLADCYDCFEKSSVLWDWHFVTKAGFARLKAEWPTVWAEFGFQDPE